MDAQKEKMLAKCAKLACLAKDQSGKPEGILAQKMLSEMMAKYRIAESEIDLSDKSASNIFEDEDGWKGLCDQFGRRQWVGDLAAAIGHTFDCRIWMSSGRGTIHYIGTVGDLETCLYFLDTVFSHVEREARKALPGMDNAKKRNVFGQSAVEVIRDRLYEMWHSMQEQVRKHYQGGTDLMVIKNDLIKKVVDDVFKDRGMKFAKNVGVKSNDSKVINAGREAGRKAPLNRGVGGSVTPQNARLN